jgi:hypothetical protein
MVRVMAVHTKTTHALIEERFWLRTLGGRGSDKVDHSEASSLLFAGIHRRSLAITV